MRIATCKRVLASLAVLMLLAMGGVFLLCWLPRPGDGITHERFEQIRVGMTLDEVEAILGVPHGDYTSADLFCSDLLGNTIYFDSPCTPICWSGDDGKIAIYLDADGRVAHKDFFEVIARLTFLDKVRHRLGL